MRSRVHQPLAHVEPEKLLVATIICFIGLAAAFVIRNATTMLKRSTVIDRLCVLDSVKGVVYDGDELFEKVLSFSVPITLTVGHGHVNLSALDDAIRSIGGTLVGVAASAEPNKRNLSVRLPKNVPIGLFLRVMSWVISALSVGGLIYVAWAFLGHEATF